MKRTRVPHQENVVPQLSEALAEHSELAAAWLFGSVARGTANVRSDVDVGILFREEPPHTLEGLGLDLEAKLELLLRFPVQVVMLNRASPDLVHRVLRDGILLVEHDRTVRVRFTVASWRRYFDLLPIWRHYRGLEVRG
jgi:predicted nucleotidyltransferase